MPSSGELYYMAAPKIVCHTNDVITKLSKEVPKNSKTLLGRYRGHCMSTMRNTIRCDRVAILKCYCIQLTNSQKMKRVSEMWEQLRPHGASESVQACGPDSTSLLGRRACLRVLSMIDRGSLPTSLSAIPRVYSFCRSGRTLHLVAAQSDVQA
jgi:hypothetical protein